MVLRGEILSVAITFVGVVIIAVCTAATGGGTVVSTALVIAVVRRASGAARGRRPARRRPLHVGARDSGGGTVTLRGTLLGRQRLILPEKSL